MERGSTVPLAALGLGSNLGDRREHLSHAVQALRAILNACRVSSLYLTRPLSAIQQPDYLNAALVGHSPLDAEQLLGATKALELAAGRSHGPRYGPRPLDVDLLLYGDAVVERPELTLPHPGLRTRRFFLAPLAEIAPDLRVPPDGTSIVELFAATAPDEVIETIEWHSFAVDQPIP